MFRVLFGGVAGHTERMKAHSFLPDSLLLRLIRRRSYLALAEAQFFLEQQFGASLMRIGPRLKSCLLDNKPAGRWTVLTSMALSIGIRALTLSRDISSLRQRACRDRERVCIRQREKSL